MRGERSENNPGPLVVPAVSCDWICGQESESCAAEGFRNVSVVANAVAEAETEVPGLDRVDRPLFWCFAAENRALQVRRAP